MPSTGQSKAPDEKNAASTSNSKGKKKLCVGGTTFTENTLAYYVGSPKNETKTKWLMHGLVVPKTPGNGLDSGKSAGEPSDGMLLDKCVVCRIYKSPLRKWKEVDEEEGGSSTSTSSASEAEVPTSSQPSPFWSAAGSLGETAAAQAPASKRRAGRRPAALSKPVAQTTLFPDGTSMAPTHANGGGSVRMPVGVGVGAGAGAAGHHGVPRLPARMEWPPAFNSMQGPVQVPRPPLMHGYMHSNGAVGMPRPPLMHGYSNRAAGMARPPLMHGYSNRAVGMQWPRPPLMPGYSNRAVGIAGHGQAPPGMQPVLTVEPPHRAAATAPNSRGHTMVMMRPANLAAGQPARPPAPPPQQQPETETEAMEAYTVRVFSRLKAEHYKLLQARQEQDNAACAGQEQASTHPECFHCAGDSRPAGVQAMLPPAEFPAPPSCYPGNSSRNLAQQTPRQQSSSATPAAVGTTPAAENPPCTESVPGAASEGSGNVDEDEIMAEIWEMVNADGPQGPQ